MITADSPYLPLEIPKNTSTAMGHSNYLDISHQGIVSHQNKDKEDEQAHESGLDSPMNKGSTSLIKKPEITL